MFTELFDLNDEREIGHIRMSREADLIVVAPATADLIAKMAGGHADDLATCVLMATDKPVLIAPAMNPRMWLHPATRRNVAQLQADGIHLVGPDIGEMAERGEAGPGRMAEVPELVEAIGRLLASSSGSVGARPNVDRGGSGELQRAPTDLSLAGRHVLVTGGPTHEPIDPVRYIANRSSGKQGAAIAAEAAALGARVTLVSGPTGLASPPGVDVVKVETAQEMLAGRARGAPGRHCHFRGCCGGLARGHPISREDQEGRQGRPQPRTGREPRHPQDHSCRRSRKRPPLVIGFAAETENVIEHARNKRKAKGADWIVANDVSPETGIMGGDRNTVHLITAQGLESWPELDKTQGRAAPRRACRRVADREYSRDMKRKSAGRAPRIKVVRLPHGEGLPLPAYQSAGAAGMDLLAAVDKPLSLRPGARALVPTGLILELPAGWEAQVRPRSGLALRHGITVLNSPGTIDSDYRGEVGVLLVNLGDKPFAIARGERIAQLVVQRVERADLIQSATTSSTHRGAGGFGSTGTAPPPSKPHGRQPRRSSGRKRVRTSRSTRGAPSRSPRPGSGRSRRP